MLPIGPDTEVVGSSAQVIRILVATGLVLFGLFGGAAFSQDTDIDLVDTLVVDGGERHWRMYVPASYEDGTPTPMVLDFHGTNSLPQIHSALSEFESLAATEGFLVATPEAVFRNENGSITWKVDLHDGAVDDVRFIRKLIDHLKRLYTTDPARIYATGMSAGGRMSSRLGCGLSDVIAAIGPVAGIRYPEKCHPTRPVPVITFHGRRDSVNQYVHQPNSPDRWPEGVEEAVSKWVVNNECNPVPTVEPVTDEVDKVSYSGCQDEADVVLYRSEDAGHTWPGSPLAPVLEGWGLGKTDADLPATTLIWSFFEAHPLKGRAGAVEPATIESLVSSSEDLSALDRKLADVYAAAAAKAVNERPPMLKAEQSRWIKGRDDCWMAVDVQECVADEYSRRIGGLQARYQLVDAKGPFRFVCDGNSANEVVVTFFATDPPTLIAERGDSTSLMFGQWSAEGAKYEGRNESFWEHQNEAMIVWGYDAPEMHCEKDG